MAFERGYLHMLLLTCVIVIYTIKNFSFKNGSPTCDNFILNVYLYLAFSIVAIGLSCYIYNHMLNPPATRNEYLSMEKIYGDIGIHNIVIAYVVCLALVVYLAFSPPFENKNFKMIHVVWLLFLFLISIGLYPSFKSRETKDVVEDSILITGSIFATMSALAYSMPSFFEKTYNFMSMAMLVSILVIIIVEVSNMIFNRDPKSLMRTFRFTSYIVIFLFTLFVSYDTQRMIMLKKMCTRLPNYPKFSMDFFLDILNLFQRIVFLKASD